MAHFFEKFLIVFFRAFQLVDCTFFFHFHFFSVGHMSYFWATGTLFWISGDVSSGFQSQSGFCLIRRIAEANVMYIPGDPPLVLHIVDLLMVSIAGRQPGSYLAPRILSTVTATGVKPRDRWVLSPTRCQLIY